MTEQLWIVYILRCCDNTLYTGVTTDIARRVASHNRGMASRYTRSRLPVALEAASGYMSRGEALRLEAAIKKLSREKKIAALTAV